MNTQQLIGLAGMLGPVIYTLIWVLGGFLQPDYNHIRDDVSSLISVGAPNKRLFDAMSLLDIALKFPLYLSLHGYIGGQGSILGPACLIIANVIGIAVVLFYPLDEGGELVTPRAKMHLNLVGVMSVLSIIGMVSLWRRMIFTHGWIAMGNYTLVSLIVTLITGLIAAKTIGTEIMGLTERLVVTATVQYFFGLGLYVYLIA